MAPWGTTNGSLSCIIDHSNRNWLYGDLHSLPYSGTWEKSLPNLLIGGSILLVLSGLVLSGDVKRMGLSGTYELLVPQRTPPLHF